MYDRIEKELKTSNKLSIQATVPTVPSSAESVELGDEPTQLRRLVDATEARLHRAQEEKEQATEALKQEKEEVLENFELQRRRKVKFRGV
jgi:hypothetical protein